LELCSKGDHRIVQRIFLRAPGEMLLKWIIYVEFIW